MPVGGGHGPIVETLLASSEPSLRWKVRTQVLDEAPGSAPIVALREEIRASDRARRLLAPCFAAGPPGVYAMAGLRMLADERGEQPRPFSAWLRRLRR